MAFLSRLLILTAFAATSSALYTARSEAPAGCADGVVVSSSTVNVGEKAVLIETVACGPQPPEKRNLFPPPKPSKSSSSVAPVPTTTDVCGEICSDVCSTNGDLPPISEDCQTIYDSVTILQGSISPTFDVSAGSVQQLTFGTCRVFFSNFQSKGTITYCWTSLAQEASAAGTLCFPPTQPVQSLGLCNAADSTWQVGVGHS